MAAAAPSPIGAHIARVSGCDTSRSSRTSSTVIVIRYWASGLSDPW
jgi:hypothetical protein